MPPARRLIQALAGRRFRAFSYSRFSLRQVVSNFPRSFRRTSVLRNVRSAVAVFNDSAGSSGNGFGTQKRFVVQSLAVRQDVNSAMAQPEWRRPIG